MVNECRPNQVNPAILSEARGLAAIYQRLGVAPQHGGANQMPPNQISNLDPDLSGRYTVPSGSFDSFTRYLSATADRRGNTSERSGFNVGILYANDQALLTCLTSQLGYNATAAQATWAEVGRRRTDGGEEAVTAYLNTLTPQQVTNYELYDALNVINIFRGLNPDVGDRFNPDGNADVISRRDFIEFVTRAFRGRATQQAKGEKLIRYMHALLGIAVFLDQNQGVPPRTTRNLTALTMTEGETPTGLTIRPSDAGLSAWPEGTAVYVGETRVQALTGTGTYVPTLGVGTHTVSVRDGDGTIQTREITVNARPPAPTPEPTVWQRISSWFSDNSNIAIPGAVVLGLGGIYLGRRFLQNRAATQEATRNRVRESHIQSFVRMRYPNLKDGEGRRIYDSVIAQEAMRRWDAAGRPTTGQVDGVPPVGMIDAATDHVLRQVYADSEAGRAEAALLKSDRRDLSQFSSEDRSSFEAAVRSANTSDRPSAPNTDQVNNLIEQVRDAVGRGNADAPIRGRSSGGNGSGGSTPPPAGNTPPPANNPPAGATPPPADAYADRFDAAELTSLRGAGWTDAQLDGLLRDRAALQGSSGTDAAIELHLRSQLPGYGALPAEARLSAIQELRPLFSAFETQARSQVERDHADWNTDRREAEIHRRISEAMRTEIATHVASSGHGLSGLEHLDTDRARDRRDRLRRGR